MGSCVQAATSPPASRHSNSPRDFMQRSRTPTDRPACSPVRTEATEPSISLQTDLLMWKSEARRFRPAHQDRSKAVAVQPHSDVYSDSGALGTRMVWVVVGWCD